VGERSCGSNGVHIRCFGGRGSVPGEGEGEGEGEGLGVVGLTEGEGESLTGGPGDGGEGGGVVASPCGWMGWGGGGGSDPPPIRHICVFQNTKETLEANP